MPTTYIGQARPLLLPSPKPWRRIVIDERGRTDAIVWADDRRRDRGVFTAVEWETIAKPWAKRYRQRLRRTKVNPYPWLVLDTDTAWPDADVCRALNELGRRLKRKLYLREGKRTRARQQQLYDDGVARYGYPAVLNYVAKPGTSRHETGDAADVGVGSFNGTNLGDYPGARAHAAALGLSFPMSWEPWHVEIRR